MPPFSLVNNWANFPEFDFLIEWEIAPENDADIVFVWVGDGLDLKVRMNDFPLEPLYSLICNGRVIIHFDDWPDFWGPHPGDVDEEE